jgi:hypothetical protein
MDHTKAELVFMAVHLEVEMVDFSDFQPSTVFPLKLNAVELPWYGPVCPVVWEGRV